MSRATVGALAVSLALVACYGASEDGGSGGGSSNGGTTSKGGTSSSAGSSGAGANTGGGVTAGSSTGGTGGTSSFSCPETAPTSGETCTPPIGEEYARAHCSWGDDPRPSCRTTALCTVDSWQVTEADPSCDSGPLPAACPSEAPQAGSVCADSSLGCWYDDGTRCWCSECEGGSQYPICQTIDPPEWACAQQAPGCPNPPAQAGSACSDEGLECGLDCEQQITCQDGRWQWSVGDCPICAAPDTPVDTPSGARPIASLVVGDLVYSVNDGAISAVPVVRTGSTPVVNHEVVRLLLADGTALEMSPGHPTADGRTFADLLRGGALNQSHAIADAALVPYQHARTYDILPESSSGAYFAGGVLVGSTLTR
jgi:hypothetical protein